MRNIQTYNAPGPRRYIGINLWGLGEPPPLWLYVYAPIGLNISRFCASSTSPRASAPLSFPSILLVRRALLLSAIAFRVFLSRFKVAPCSIRVPSSFGNKNHYFPRQMPSFSNKLFKGIYNFGKERQVSKNIFHRTLTKDLYNILPITSKYMKLIVQT